MKALVCNELGRPDSLDLEDAPVPTPGEGEVLIEVHAAGVNFPDGLLVAGEYQTKPSLPFVPGSEVAGVVAALGDGVSGVSVGQRVMAFTTLGGYATHALAPTHHVYPIPDALSFVDAAIIPVAYGTSFHGLIDRARLSAGEIVLVLGASGGVGLSAVAIAKAKGARVIAAASTPEKLELAQAHGADDLINYRDEDLGERLKELTENRGVDVVYDPVGGDHAETVVRRLAWGGRYLTVGYAAGPIPKVGMNRFLLKEAELLGVLWGAWAGRNPEHNQRNMAELAELVANGEIRTHVHGTWPLEQGAQALETVMSRGVLGKCVITTKE